MLINVLQAEIDPSFAFLRTAAIDAIADRHDSRLACAKAPEATATICPLSSRLKDPATPCRNQVAGRRTGIPMTARAPDSNNRRDPGKDPLNDAGTTALVDGSATTYLCPRGASCPRTSCIA